MDISELTRNPTKKNRSSDKNLLLFEAIESDNLEMITKCLDDGADPNFKMTLSNKKLTPLARAMEAFPKKNKIFDLLLNWGADINLEIEYFVRDEEIIMNNRSSLLFLKPLEDKSYDASNYLLTKGLNPNKISSSDSSVQTSRTQSMVPFLYKQIDSSSIKLVELLIKFKADVNSQYLSIHRENILVKRLYDPCICLACSLDSEISSYELLKILLLNNANVNLERKTEEFIIKNNYVKNIISTQTDNCLDLSIKKVHPKNVWLLTKIKFDWKVSKTENSLESLLTSVEPETQSIRSLKIQIIRELISRDWSKLTFRVLPYRLKKSLSSIAVSLKLRNRLIKANILIPILRMTSEIWSNELVLN